MEIRRYFAGEESEIWALYFDTTHRVVAREYTANQVDRWAPSTVDMEAWSQKLARTNPFVAVDATSIWGFAELEPDGHIGNIYVHHERQRRGIGTALLSAIEKEAKSRKLECLFAEVSTTAIHFFRSMGFEIQEERVNTVCGAPAKQFMVRKRLRT